MTADELARRMTLREFNERMAEDRLRVGGEPQTDPEAALRAELTAKVKAGLAAKRAAMGQKRASRAGRRSGPARR